MDGHWTEESKRSLVHPSFRGDAETYVDTCTPIQRQRQGWATIGRDPAPANGVSPPW